MSKLCGRTGREAFSRPVEARHLAQSMILSGGPLYLNLLLQSQG
jgi:hypothetical protein